jgi:hypothetical protein
VSKKQTWDEMSFLGNFAAAADALGQDGIGVAWGIAAIPFSTMKDRERFLNALVMMPRDGSPQNLLSHSQTPITFPEGMPA